MSALVRGFDVPNYCYECPFHSRVQNGMKSQYWCGLLLRFAHDEEGHKTEECPIEYVPDEKEVSNPSVVRTRRKRV